MGRTLIIGVGERHRRDDAVGLLVTEQLKAQLPDSLEVIERCGDGAALMEVWKGAERVFIIDAVCSGSRPGTIFRYDASSRPLPSERFQCSTHSFGIAEAIEVARSLGELPSELIIYGIEGESFTMGTSVSQVVAESARKAADLIANEATSASHNQR